MLRRQRALACFRRCIKEYRATFVGPTPFPPQLGLCTTTMSMSNVVNLTFNLALDEESYKKAFCIKPPDDSCPFTPCPNGDVTGVGNQVSVYITTFIYGIVLTYIPWLLRPMMYAHLSVLFSFYIAATISIRKEELTQTDGLFVLISVVSPATLYLWYLSIRSFWNAEIFPMEHANKKKVAGASWEIHIMRLIVLSSLAWAIAMIVVLFVDSDRIKFSQPACNKTYGTALWYNLAWELPFAIQMVAILLLCSFAWSVCWLWTARSSYRVPSSNLLVGPSELLEDKPSTGGAQIDIITWTEHILNDIFPQFMNKSLLRMIITVLQISSLPTLSYIIESKDYITWLLITIGLFRHRPKPDSNWVKEYVIRVLVSIFFAGVAVTRTVILPLIPTGPDYVFLFLVYATCAWCWKNFTNDNMRVFLPVFLVFFSLITVVGNIFVVIVGDGKAFDTSGIAPPDGNYVSFFVLNIVSVAIWFVAWLSTSTWAFKQRLTWNKIGKGLWRRAHWLKCFWLVIGPHILWIQASNNASPSRTNDLPFGQIFALIIAVVTVITLADEAKDVSKDVWMAFIKSDPMPYDDDERPKHYALRPGMALS